MTLQPERIFPACRQRPLLFTALTPYTSLSVLFQTRSSPNLPPCQATAGTDCTGWDSTRRGFKAGWMLPVSIHLIAYLFMIFVSELMKADVWWSLGAFAGMSCAWFFTVFQSQAADYFQYDSGNAVNWGIRGTLWDYSRTATQNSFPSKSETVTWKTVTKCQPNTGKLINRFTYSAQILGSQRKCCLYDLNVGVEVWHYDLFVKVC